MDEAHITRFWEKVDHNGPVVRPELGKCWVWTASKRSGYGAFTVQGAAKQAHRVSYELEYDEAPPLLRHKCDNRACIRPTHLEPGTAKDNTRDRLERNPNATTLTMEQVVEARRLAASGHSVHYIQRKLGASRSILVNAIQGKGYRHVSEPTVELKDLYRPIYNKLTEDQYTEILEALKKPYHGQGKKLAAQYGVHPSLITLIKKRKLKTIRGASQK